MAVPEHLPLLAMAAVAVQGSALTAVRGVMAVLGARLVVRAVPVAVFSTTAQAVRAVGAAVPFLVIPTLLGLRQVHEMEQ